MAVQLLAVAFLLGILAGPAAAAEPGRPAAPKTGAGPKVRVELISEAAGIESGASFWVGLRQRIAPGWHTYWLNPGDSGEPPSIEWALPRGFDAGEIAWPHPERIPVGPLMSYGYTREVVLLTRLTAPAGLEPGTRVTLRGHAAWLVCETHCIPEEADVALTLPVVPVKAGIVPRAVSAIAQARRAVPIVSPWPASFSATPETVSVSITAPRLAAERIAEAWFFPSQWGVINHASPQAMTISEGGMTLRIARGALPGATEGPLEGVLVMRERLDQGPVSQAFAIRATSAGAPLAAASGAGSVVSFPQAIGLALVGGLILNLMPCVLPVLSVKTLSLITHAEASAGELRRHGLVFTAGVLVSFATVAGALIALRAGGAEIGWGFQLQSPLVVTVLAYVFFLLALSLSGFLVIGARVTGLGQGLASRPGLAGSFFTGALAAVAATPCTAPFMGVAVGFALTQPATTALLIFEALGLGLALPYLALSLVPSWRRALPTPGLWMERLKQLLAVPLYATVAWLVWVVSRQTGPEGVAAVLAGLLLIGVAVWLNRAARVASRRGRMVTTAAAVVAVAAALALGQVAASSSPASSRASSGASGAGGAAWEPFSPQRFAELRAQGRPIFINFTAAWCITCLVNERVLEWTNHDCPYVRKHYETGNMQALQREATGQGVVWLTIISSAKGEQGYVTAAQADELTATRKAALTAVLLDPAGTVGRLYGATNTPHMYVVDKAGLLVYAGAIDDRATSRRADVQGANNYVRAALQAVAAGEPVKTPVTRAYGCTVKYS